MSTVGLWHRQQQLDLSQPPFQPVGQCVARSSAGSVIWRLIDFQFVLASEVVGKEGSKFVSIAFVRYCSSSVPSCSLHAGFVFFFDSFSLVSGIVASIPGSVGRQELSSCNSHRYYPIHICVRGKGIGTKYYSHPRPITMESITWSRFRPSLGRRCFGTTLNRSPCIVICANHRSSLQPSWSYRLFDLLLKSVSETEIHRRPNTIEA